MNYRTERDALGSVKVPSEAYYGSETERAITNFKISGLKVYTEFIRAYIMIKRAAAVANMKSGKLDKKIQQSIIKACDILLKGSLADQFPIDVFQAGAGTNTNMNVNEVIANLALEIYGKKRGNYSTIHPNDHVNMSQSTNDTYHAAIHVASYLAIHEKLLPSLYKLSKTLESKSKAFNDIIMIGRTHLRDAVPIKLGQEYYGYSGAVSKSAEIILHESSRLLELPIGGTAVGTGINTTPRYKQNVIIELNRFSGKKFLASKNIFADMQNQIEELSIANALSSTAVTLGKIANDVRLESSGPVSGLNEISIPEVQPGSSIMPGKINPSVAEMLNMVCFQVIGNASVVREAASAGQFELNVFMPVISYNLLYSIKILTNAIDTFTDRCISGIRANTKSISNNLKRNLSIATALTPYIGYSKAAEIANEAYRKNISVKEACIKAKVLDEKTLDSLLDPSKYV